MIKKQGYGDSIVIAHKDDANWVKHCMMTEIDGTKEMTRNDLVRVPLVCIQREQDASVQNKSNPI